MTRHSLGYLLSERAKAQRHHVLAPVSQEKETQQEASDVPTTNTIIPPSEQHPNGTDSVVIEGDNVPESDQRNPGNTTQ